MVRTIFDQPDPAAVRAQFGRVVEAIAAKFGDAAEHLDQAREDLLAFADFPHEIWRQIWSNNPQERLNKEIRRRTDVVGIFPNRAAHHPPRRRRPRRADRRMDRATPLHGHRDPHQSPNDSHRRPPQRGGDPHGNHRLTCTRITR